MPAEDRIMDEYESREGWTRLDSIKIDSEYDIVKSRQVVRYYAKELEMGIVDQTRITTAVSELFRNMFQYAGGGTVIIEKGEFKDRTAIIITCIDNGPGIADLEQAMTDGYSSGNGMGYGLPGAKRLVDDFAIDSAVGKGTRIRVIKWI